MPAVEGSRRKKKRLAGPGDDAPVSSPAPDAVYGQFRCSVTDCMHGGKQATQVEVPMQAKVKGLLEEIAKVWTNWVVDDMVLVVFSGDHEGRKLVVTETVGDLALGSDPILCLFHRGQEHSSFDKVREEEQRDRERDNEDWGAFSDEERKLKIELIQRGPQETHATFTWKGEEHTVGNALRHVLIQDRSVLQCGYTIPHPLEDRMQMDVRSRVYPPALVGKGLLRLSSICETAAERFDAAYNQFLETEGGDVAMSQ
eukprot:Hpha_TRINITY_DN13024_c1_g1::TRINITY_DN13024_c1_g1_i2::g.68957::m.68957